MPPETKSRFASRNSVRYTLAASVTIATLLGAQRLAFNERPADSPQSQKLPDAPLPSETMPVPTTQPSATAMPTSTTPLTNTPSQVLATATKLSSTQATVAATVTTVQPTNTQSPTATLTQVPSATQMPTRVVVAPQQPRPQSHSSKS
jgi:hypothetical protein